MSKHNICILLPFFGQWPSYFPAYLKGCEGNPEIDFLFFTNISPPREYPENVRFLKSNLREISQLASKKLNIRIDITWPYKLCDLRPAFGIVFEDYVRDYEFWGHGDIDVIYGEISRFITPEVLHDHDVISVRREWISGPFTLYRNIPGVNLLFRNEPQHARIFQDSAFLGFDETGKQWQIYERTDDLSHERGLDPSMTLLVLDAARHGKIRARFFTVIKEWLFEGDCVVVESGRVRDISREEYLLYHFRERKICPTFSMPTWDIAPDKYSIYPTGFCHEGKLCEFD